MTGYENLVLTCSIIIINFTVFYFIIIFQLNKNYITRKKKNKEIKNEGFLIDLC